MKTFTKLAVAAVLALSAAAPAFAFDPEGQTLLERNTYNYTADARLIAAHQNAQVGAHRGTEAMAQAPRATHEAVSGQYYNERNVQ